MTSTVETVSAAPGQYLGLFIGGEEYAIAILRVKEILQLDSLTRVPGAPPGIRGVINVRGSVVPVVDLALRFALPETAVTQTTCVVIVEAELAGARTVMGVMAEAVSQVLDLRAEDIQPPPPFGTRARVDYLLGMARSGRRFSLILDIDGVLSDRDVAAASALADSADAPAGVAGEVLVS